MSNKKQDLNFSGVKSAKDVMKICKEHGSPVSNKQAEAIFQKVKNKEISDKDLDNVSGGGLFGNGGGFLGLGDKDPQLFKVGEVVGHEDSYMSYDNFNGVIEKVSKEEESIFGLNPEWRYYVHYNCHDKTSAKEGYDWFWESDLNHNPTY